MAKSYARGDEDRSLHDDGPGARHPGRRLPRGFRALLSAQFTSALADNALLIVTIAILLRRGDPAWMAPALKFVFTLSYVLFAPVVGELADAFPKARLMAWMNGIKILGLFLLLFGAHPLLAFAVVGLGAAAYAPAKYGLVTELVAPRQLVAANGWLEVSIIAAVICGTAVGGLLVSPGLLDASALAPANRAIAVLLPEHAGSALALPLSVLLAIYLLAGTLNILVPDSGARYARSAVAPLALARDFWRANLTLWRDRDGGLSLAATTIFWGVGATMQFAVIRWSADVLDLSLDRAAYLQAASAVGVVFGAMAAARWVPLARARNVLTAGIMLGPLLPVIASTTQLPSAIAGLVLCGAIVGLVVVPLNALLQHRGCVLLSAGRSIAVQGFNENASVLAMLGIYAGLLAMDLSIVGLLWGLGLSIAASIAVLIRRDRLRWRSAAESRAPV